MPATRPILTYFGAFCCWFCEHSELYARSVSYCATGQDQVKLAAPLQPAGRFREQYGLWSRAESPAFSQKFSRQLDNDGGRGLSWAASGIVEDNNVTCEPLAKSHSGNRLIPASPRGWGHATYSDIPTFGGKTWRPVCANSTLIRWAGDRRCGVSVDTLSSGVLRPETTRRAQFR